MAEEEGFWVSYDGCVKKTVVTPGKWGTVAHDGAKCRLVLLYAATADGFPHNKEQEEALNNSLYFSPSVRNVPDSLVMGEADSELDRVLETCVRAMLPLEVCKATLFFRSREQDKEEPQSLQKAPVPAISLQINLLEVEAVPPVYLWSDEKKFEEALRHRVVGVNLFGQGRTVDAFLRFSKATRLLICMVVDGEEVESKIKSLRGALYANMASCQLKRENYVRADDLCTRSLAMDDANVKVLYRRGVARTHLQEYEHACEDLERAKMLDPKNEAVKKALLEAKKKKKELDARYGAAVKKAFNLW
ncbi:70 kDa peptidyl-prolyl isomerase-like [Ischnura elegans]|uniref:70 kDa peptidyl-prolyl isomerase-like n=1 Tax=Ischnura elegans TaxID=197161 RepID=UPI001ED874B2|nr:70 kDa peptidyl-prolyl isomerase-like [Ischnura elegans]